MKHLKTYEGIFDIFKRKPKETDAKKIEIIKLCKLYNIENYTINDDYSVDVDGSVDIGNRKLTKIPIKFGKVTGFFSCVGNMLVDLENSPKWVDKNFMCQYQYNGSLISLKGAPKHVGYRFDCHNNENLTSLEYMPEYVGYLLDFQYTGIYSFDFMIDVIGLNCKATPIGNIIAMFPGFANRLNSNEYLKYVEIIRDFDPIRPPDTSGGRPIIIADRFNDFLFEINPKRTKYFGKEQTPKTYAILSKYYDIL